MSETKETKETPSAPEVKESPEPSTPATKVIVTKKGPVTFQKGAKDLQTTIAELEKKLQNSEEKRVEYENAMALLKNNPKHKNVLDDLFAVLGW